jgi:predicted Zn-dependent protease with MMP-like domain
MPDEWTGGDLGGQPQGPFTVPRGRVSTFLRHANPRQAASISVVVGLMAATTLYGLHQLELTGYSLALIAVMIPIVLVVSVLLSAKLVSDAADIHARTVAAQEQRAAARRFGDDLPFDCSEDEFARIAEQELEALPDWLEAKIRDANVAFGIEDERPGEPRVLGLYSRAGGQSQITLYRAPIVRAAGGPDRLRRQIHDTLLHELGHLFGMTEADLDRYTIGNNPLPDAAPVRPPSWE